MPTLTHDDVTKFETDGFALPEVHPFSDDTFRRLVEVFEDDLDRYGPDDLDVMHARDDRLFEFLLDDGLLDMVKSIIGPNIGLWSSHFICKPAGTGKATPWHEDASYWDGRMDRWEHTLTVWVALDDVDRDNGCMRVIPGSHLTPPSQYVSEDLDASIFGLKIVDGAVDESASVDLCLTAGMCSIHDARLVHGAVANRSYRRRAGYTMRYFPTTSRINVEKNGDHPVWLARGVDVAGNPFVNGSSTSRAAG